MKKTFIVSILLFFLNISNGEVFTLQIENDAFIPNSSDRHYTHGTFLSIKNSDKNEIILNDLFHNNKEKEYMELSFFQYLYTPSDITIDELLKDDRPYGGILACQISFVGYNDFFYNKKGFVFGVVGPWSLADKTQIKIHEWTNSKTPKYWEGQIDNEVVLNFIDNYKYKFLDNTYYDLIINCGYALGNAHTYINGGISTRMGYNVSNDFGDIFMEPIPKNIQSRSFLDHFGIYLILGIENRYVLRNIFLDGNTFSDSHSVDKEDYVYDLYGGFSIDIKDFKITYKYTERSKEFKKQKENNNYGTLMFSFAF
jgi:lipid A 3-O-deacylase